MSAVPASGDAVAGVGGCDVVRGGYREALVTAGGVEAALPCEGAAAHAGASVIKTAIAQTRAR